MMFLSLNEDLRFSFHQILTAEHWVLFCEHLQISFIFFRRENFSTRLCFTYARSVNARGLNLAGTRFDYRLYLLSNFILAGDIF